LEASSGQAITFCLQAQDEIASRRFLFHRQGEPFIPQMIKDCLPYFVGAMEEDHFQKKKRYDDAVQRLKRLQRQYTDALALANETSGNARSLLAEGQRVGLIPRELLTPTPNIFARRSRRRRRRERWIMRPMMIAVQILWTSKTNAVL
jgi:hypothetical protein